MRCMYVLFPPKYTFMIFNNVVAVDDFVDSVDFIVSCSLLTGK